MLLSYLTAFSLLCHAQGIDRAPAPLPAKNITIFGRGIYPGDDTTYALLKASGYNTLMLSSFYIHADGDLYSGDSHTPIIHDGKWVGDTSYLRRIADVKKHSSISRIEILLEGRWYGQPPNTFDFIKDWTDSSLTAPAGIVSGIGTNSTLYKICKVLKEVVGADAFCIDDESVYDSRSIILMGKIAASLNMHMTLCPFRGYTFWGDILKASDKKVVDALYLQCYDGGIRNNPTDWVNNLKPAQPVYPIFLCRGAFSICGTSHNSKTPAEIKADMIRFKQGYPGMTGAAIWQIADVKSYVINKCAVTDPASGSATSVSEYLQQIKSSLETGL